MDGRASALAELQSAENAINAVASNELKAAMDELLVADLRKMPPPLKLSEEQPFRDGWTLERLKPWVERALEGDGVIESGPFDVFRRLAEHDENDVYSPRAGDVQLVATPGQKPPDQRPLRLGFLCRQLEDEGNWYVVALRGDYGPYSRGLYESEPYDFTRRWGWNSRLALPSRLAPAILPAVTTPDDARVAAVSRLVNEVMLRRLDLRAQLVSRVHNAHVEAVQPLILPEVLEKLRHDVPQTVYLDLPAAEFDLVEDRGDAIVVRMHDRFKSNWVFELEQVDDAWHVSGIKRRFTATRVRDGVEVERLADAPDAWSVLEQKPPQLAAFFR